MYVLVAGPQLIKQRSCADEKSDINQTMCVCVVAWLYLYSTSLVVVVLMMCTTLLVSVGR